MFDQMTLNTQSEHCIVYSCYFNSTHPIPNFWSAGVVMLPMVPLRQLALFWSCILHAATLGFDAA